MPRHEIEREFQVSQRMVDTARGLPTFSPPPPKKSKGIAQDVKKAVMEFYCDDEYTRLLPGQKDRVSIGNKVYEQKRLILVTLQELYHLLKDKHPGMKIGKSLFRMLRPKWCKSARSSGTLCLGV